MSVNAGFLLQFEPTGLFHSNRIWPVVICYSQETRVYSWLTHGQHNNNSVFQDPALELLVVLSAYISSN